MLVATPSNMRRGGPLFHINKIVSARGVQIVSYDTILNDQAYNVFNDYVYLAIDKFKHKLIDDNCKRRVLYLGGFKIKYNGIPRHSKFVDLDHVVFPSQFYADMCLSEFPQLTRDKCKIIYMIAPMPVDNVLEPVLEPRSIDGTIHFLAIAKWWKRNFKRQRQTTRLFNKYILAKYPNSLLHVLGCGKSTFHKGNVIYYQEGFSKPEYIDMFKRAHISLIFTPFDTGPKTIAESLYYRVPFVCSNNCVGKEFISYLGSCGKMVKIDPDIKSSSDIRAYKPLTRKEFYDKNIDYLSIMDAIDEIVENFKTYTSWEWTNELSPETEAKKWVDVLSV
tara:strand:+ start:992 stop:1993 length:1002 start_codon:yes stop_codon:yes gene_type:complete